MIGWLSVQCGASRSLALPGEDYHAMIPLEIDYQSGKSGPGHDKQLEMSCNIEH